MRLPLVLGLSLFLLLPALNSTHTILNGPDYTALVEWTKYWTMIALAGIAEIAVLKQVPKIAFLFLILIVCLQLNGRVSIALKCIFLTWLLLPVHYNGSRVIFDLVFTPVHDTVLQLASETKYLVLSVLVSGLDDILQPLVTSTLTSAESGLQMAKLTLLQCEAAITPPLKCAGAVIINSPNLLVTSITNTSNNILDLVNIFSIFINEIFSSCFGTTTDFFNCLLDYIVSFLHLLASVTYSIFEEILILFEDPINEIKRHSLRALSVCQYLTSKVTEYYEYNKHFPLLFSDIFKSIKKIFISKAMKIVQKIFRVLDHFTQVFRFEVLPVARQFFSNVEFFSKASLNGT